MNITPPAPRFTTETLPGGIRACIPARKNWFVIPFLCVWLTGWAFGEINVFREILSPSHTTPVLFLSVWLIGWTIGGAFALGGIVWQLGGKEIITIDAINFEHRLEVFGLGWSRFYTLANLKNVRVTQYGSRNFPNQGGWMPPLMGSGHGPLAFDYGARTYHLGPALDEAEARLLLEHLEHRLPRRLNEL